MGKSYAIQRLDRPGLTFVKITGAIDESFNGAGLVSDLHGDTIFHLGGITRFSSFGVREWVNMMRALKGRVRHALLVECSPAVVNQLNVVVDFTAGAHVKSFHLPFVCPKCQRDRAFTVD